MNESEHNWLDEEGVLRKEASPAQNILSGLIDAVIVVVTCLFVTLYFNLLQYTEGMDMLWLIIISLFGYRLITLLFFNATLGMLFCGCRLGNHQANSPTFVQKILAAFMVLFHGARYYGAK